MLVHPGVLPVEQQQRQRALGCPRQPDGMRSLAGSVIVIWKSKVYTTRLGMSQISHYNRLLYNPTHIG